MRALVVLGSLRLCAAYNGYSVSSYQMTYVDAVAYCDGVGGEMASIHSEADNEAAREACGNQMCWIGLRESGGDAGTHAFEQTWRWPDNSTAGADTYHNWGQGEPKNKDSGYFGDYEDQRHAMMNSGFGQSTGLWFSETNEYPMYAICSVNAPTTAPTLSPAPTTSPRPTYSFSCDNDRCGLLEEEDCCEQYSEPVCSGGYVPVKFGDHSCLFACCTVAVSHEEVTASGHQWENHEDRNSRSGGGGGGGAWHPFYLFILILYCAPPVIITSIISCLCVRCGCCKMCLPPKLVYKDLAATPPTIPSGVELTAPATTVNAPPPAQVYKASIVASEGV